MRIGAKKKPFYRVVVLDERAKRTGAYIELLGTYNPLTEPKEIKLKQDRIDHWIKQGAQLSTGFLRIIGKAPQRPPRKPKKEKKTTGPSAVSGQTSEKPEETPANTSDGGTEGDSSEVSETKEIPTETALEQPVEEAVKPLTEESQDATEVKPEEVVVAEDQTKIATVRQGGPRDDKVEESEKKDEGSA